MSFTGRQNSLVVPFLSLPILTFGFHFLHPCCNFGLQGIMAERVFCMRAVLSDVSEGSCFSTRVAAMLILLPISKQQDDTQSTTVLVSLCPSV